jgi:hypothetical protein
MNELTPEERSRIMREIVNTVGRILMRLKGMYPPLPVKDHRKVIIEEIPKLKELLEKVV